MRPRDSMLRSVRRVRFMRETSDVNEDIRINGQDVRLPHTHTQENLKVGHRG